VTSPPAGGYPLRLKAESVRHATQRTEDFDTQTLPLSTVMPANAGIHMDGHVHGLDTECGGGGGDNSLSLSKIAGQISGRLEA